MSADRACRERPSLFQARGWYMHISVLGMHRSGTSLVAGILGVAGVYLGEDDDLVGADQWNSAGYWEHSALIQFDDGLLRHFGGTWYAPPMLVDGWLEDAVVVTWLSEAQAYVEARFGKRALWAHKEPRATLLLPFWNKIIPETKQIICVRNPLDVAASLYSRDGMVLEYGAALWHIYTVRALMDTAADSRCVVHYEDIVKDYRTALSPLFAFTGMLNALTDETWRNIGKHVNIDLKHHGHTMADLLSNPNVLEPTKRLYRALVEHDTAELESGEFKSERVLRQLYDYVHYHRRAFDLLEKTREENAEMETLRRVLNSRSHRMASSLRDVFTKWQGMRSR